MKRLKNHFSSLLHNNFLQGASNVFDIYGSNSRRIYEEIASRSDSQSIASDWITVGNDFKKALNCPNN